MDHPQRSGPARVDETRYITAHLIDCRSFGGFSGSPCYLQKERVRVGSDETAGSVGVYNEYRTLLFGLIGGHFDDWAGTQQRREGDDEYAISDDIRAPVGTGVGYVIPAEYIRETLMRDELEEMRLRYLPQVLVLVDTRGRHEHGGSSNGRCRAYREQIEEWQPTCLLSLSARKRWSGLNGFGQC